MWFEKFLGFISFSLKGKKKKHCSNYFGHELAGPNKRKMKSSSEKGRFRAVVIIAAFYCQMLFEFLCPAIWGLLAIIRIPQSHGPRSSLHDPRSCVLAHGSSHQVVPWLPGAAWWETCEKESGVEGEGHRRASGCGFLGRERCECDGSIFQELLVASRWTKWP